MGRTVLRNEDALKAYLKSNRKGGRCIHYQLYKSLSRCAPATASQIIRDLEKHAPGVASNLTNDGVGQKLRFVSWVTADRSTQTKEGVRQITWHLNLSENFHDEEE